MNLRMAVAQGASSQYPRGTCLPLRQGFSFRLLQISTMSDRRFKDETERGTSPMKWHLPLAVPCCNDAFLDALAGSLHSGKAG